MTQFRKIAFLWPKPGMSLAEFYAYWRGTHGPVVANSPGYVAYRTRYAQNHKIADGPVGGKFEHPGIAEFHIPGDGSNEEAFAKTPIYRDRIRVDELNFIDMNRTVSMTAVEEVRSAGKGGVKLMIVSGRAAGSSRSAFDALLAGDYAKAVFGTPGFSEKVIGWTLDHVVEGSFRLPGARPVETAPVDCIQALRFKSVADLNAAYASDGYRSAIRPIEQRLLSMDNTSSFVAEEIVFFEDGRPLVAER